MKLTTGKKQKDDAIVKGARIGASYGIGRGAARSVLAASAMGMSNKAKLAAGIAGGLNGMVKGAITGAGIGAGVKAVNTVRKKKNFNNNELVGFKKNKKESDIIGQFPTDAQEKNKKKKSSLIDEAKNVLKDKDNLNTKKVKTQKVVDNIKNNISNKLIMKK